MAIYYARKSGNVNASDVWATTPTGVAAPRVFVSGDILIANSFTITVNVSTDLGSTGSVANDVTGGATAGGTFNLSSGVTLTANVSTTALSNSVGVDLPTGSATIVGNVTGGAGTGTIGARNSGGGTLTIVGNVTGGSGAGAGAQGVMNSQNGTVNITGTVTGGSVSNNHGVYNNVAGTVIVNGNVLGGTGTSCSGIVNITGTVNITGNVTGGSSGNTSGVGLSGAGSITITGNVTGGINSGGIGAYNGGNGTITIIGTAVSSGSAIGAQNFSTGTLTVTRAKGNGFGNGSVGLNSVVGVSASQNGLTRVYEIEFGDLGQSPTSGPVSFFNSTTNKALVYRPSLSKKTLTDPASTGDYPLASDVRNGISYNNGGNTGTLIVPNASQVSIGVAVDNTVGTALLTPSGVWDYLTSSIATSGSIGERLKNCSTIASVGQQLSNSLS